MEISNQPTQYEPSVDESNNYVDKVPSTTLLLNGVICGCCTRTTIFKNRQTISSHFKTVSHQKWLEQQNRNKLNHLTELLNLRELTKQQTILIAERDQKIIKLEKNIRENEIAIRTLSSLLSNSTRNITENVDLLDIDN
jgi:hypothetical protein